MSNRELCEHAGLTSSTYRGTANELTEAGVVRLEDLQLVGKGRRCYARLKNGEVLPKFSRADYDMAIFPSGSHGFRVIKYRPEPREDARFAAFMSRAMGVFGEANHG